MRTAEKNVDILKTLKSHIGMGLEISEAEDESLDIQVRIAEIGAEFKEMLSNISAETVDSFDEEKVKELMNEKSNLQSQLDRISNINQKRENAKSRLGEIYTVLDVMKNHPLQYDDIIVRQLIEFVAVESKEQIKVIFIGGLTVTERLY